MANRASSPRFRCPLPRGKYRLKYPLPSFPLAEPQALIGDSGTKNIRLAFRTVEIDGQPRVVVQSCNIIANIGRPVRQLFHVLPIDPRSVPPPQQHNPLARHFVRRHDLFDAPYASMVHDFMVTRNYVLFPVLPLTGSMQRAVSGKPAYAWEADKRSYVGVLKRNADVSTIRWFECDPCYVFHPMNAYEEDDRIVGDVMQYDAAPLFPDPDGRPGDPTKAVAYLTRWTFDLNANTNAFKRKQIDDLAGEFPRFDERSAGLSYRHGYFAASSDSRFVDQFDTLAHMDLRTNKRTAYQLPKGDVVSEPIFIPRNTDAREADGYLLATIYRGAEKRSDLAVFDTVSLEAGPIALAELSHRVPFGFHGNWRPM
jgi:carotenoid cleavage dioxygenase-like enzyme